MDSQTYQYFEREWNIFNDRLILDSFFIKTDSIEISSKIH